MNKQKKEEEQEWGEYWVDEEKERTYTLYGTYLSTIATESRDGSNNNCKETE